MNNPKMTPKQAATRNVQEQIANRLARQEEAKRQSDYKESKEAKLAKRQEKERLDNIKEAVTRERGKMRFDNDEILYGKTDEDTKSAIDAGMEFKRLNPNRPHGIHNAIMNDLMLSRQKRDVPDAKEVMTDKDDISDEDDIYIPTEYAFAESRPFFRPNPTVYSYFAQQAIAQAKEVDNDDEIPSLTRLDINAEADTKAYPKDDSKYSD